MEDIRCKYCNWLNKSVQGNFICKNCGKSNAIVLEKKLIKKVDNIQIESKKEE